MAHENVIIAGIIGYWVLSILATLARIYFIRVDYYKWSSRRENEMVDSFIKSLWQKLVVGSFQEANKYSRAYFALIMIPVTILVMLAPPLILPFEIIGFFITIPNRIEKRRKRKAQMEAGGIVGSKEKSEVCEEYQGGYSGNAETIIPETEKHD
jgi:cytochrome c oxidase assembly factor CtaG